MIRDLLLCAAGLGLSSILGSAIGLFVRRIPHSWNDVFLGFCAGMMLTASIVCLILPAVEMSAVSSWWQVVAGVASGVALIGVLDCITPHLHHLSGDTRGGAAYEQCLAQPHTTVCDGHCHP